MKKTGTLLRTPQPAESWRVKITLSQRQWAELTFSVRTMAEQEYHRIKSQGIYGGLWVEEIVLAAQS